jgi:plasmid stability protein
MGRLVVRNIDDVVLARLRKRAKRCGISLEELARQVLLEASRPSRHELVADMDRIANMSPPRKGPPISHLLVRDTPTKPSLDKLIETARRIRAMSPPRTKPPFAEHLIREDRDR